MPKSRLLVSKSDDKVSELVSKSCPLVSKSDDRVSELVSESVSKSLAIVIINSCNGSLFENVSLLSSLNARCIPLPAPV